jgi:uncharacterized protein YndB with AHSA1/START domain
MKSLVLAAALLALAGAARAEVVETGPSGFRLKTVRQVAAPPAKVFEAIGQWGRWWSDAHTYSGKAANLTVTLQPGACLCEALPGGGGVRHGVVEAAIPGRLVRLDTALGPLQDEGVSGALAFTLKPKAGGTELTTTYNVGGARDAIVRIAPNVDEVLTEAVGRLQRYAETGRPSGAGQAP